MSKPRTNTQRTIGVPDDQWQQLDRTARAMGTDRTKLVNRLIAWVNRTEGVTVRRPPRQ